MNLALTVHREVFIRRALIVLVFFYYTDIIHFVHFLSA